MVKQIKEREYKPFISVIIPIEKETEYLNDAIYHYSLQTYKNFELFISSSSKISVKKKFAKVIIDKKLKGDVSSKRNKIITYGRGEIFIFNDDDVCVPKNYLKNIVGIFKNQQILAVCGPLLTPANDNFRQKASGAVWESYLGSLGAGIYRSRKMPARIVYDYPAANLIVRKNVFKKVGGFEPKLYPGEDTKFCLLLLNYYKKGINYDPNLLVYHHRKSLFKNHLKQIGRYGSQRGWFSLSYPTTSFQIQYFLPAVFLLYLLFLILFSMFSYFTSSLFKISYFYIPLFVYFILLLIDGTIIVLCNNINIAIFAIVGIILTHLYYGYKFIKSFISKFISKFSSLLKL